MAGEGLCIWSWRRRKLAETLHTERSRGFQLGAPDNHPSEPDFSPSVYKAGTESAGIYDEIAARIATKLEESI